MDEEMIPEGEEQMAEEVPAEESVPAEAAPAEEMAPEGEPTAAPAAPADGPTLPPEMMETMQKGAEALFYTAVQVASDPQAKRLLRKYLPTGKVRLACEFIIDQSLKIHKKQGFPITAPMVLAAAYWITMYVCSLSRASGAKVSPQQERLHVAEVMDWFLGQVNLGEIDKKYGDRARSWMQRQQEGAQQPPGAPGAPPPGGDMGGLGAAPSPGGEGGLGASQPQPEPQGGLM
jgi:hypothetical protein